MKLTPDEVIFLIPHGIGLPEFHGSTGYGTGPADRGIRFYYEWVRDNVGRWEYPHHVPSTEFSLDAPASSVTGG